MTYETDGVTSSAHRTLMCPDSCAVYCVTSHSTARLAHSSGGRAFCVCMCANLNKQDPTHMRS